MSAENLWTTIARLDGNGLCITDAVVCKLAVTVADIGLPSDPLEAIFMLDTEGLGLYIVDDDLLREGLGLPPFDWGDDGHAWPAIYSTCPACATINAYMGILGNLRHYRCSACGLQYSEEA